MSDLRQRETAIRSTKVLRSAKGQSCSIRVPGICNSNPETTVWAHLNGHAFGKGMAIKAHDILGFHACSDCHAYYDTGHGRRQIVSTLELLELVMSAVCETYVRLVRAGIVVVPQDVETSFHEKQTPKRKPKAERTPVRPSRPLSTGNHQHTATTPPTKTVRQFARAHGDTE